MKASKLIKQLEAIIELYGDGDIEVNFPEKENMGLASDVTPYTSSGDECLIGGGGASTIVIT